MGSYEKKGEGRMTELEKKVEELNNAVNVILNYIDDKEGTRPLFHELIAFCQRVQRDHAGNHPDQKKLGEEE